MGYYRYLRKTPPILPPLGLRREVQKYSTSDVLMLLALGPFTVGVTWAMLLFNE